MRILSVSTATNNLSVALNNNEKIVVEKQEVDQRNHSEHLDPLIQEVLLENNLKLKDIDRFAVAIGPGSYTGLRIGITTIKMFSSILNKEVVGVSTLKALAKSVTDEKTLVIAGLDARNDNYFAGGYVIKDNNPESVIDDGHYHIDILLVAAKEFLENNSDYNKVLFVGSGFDKQEDLIKAAGFDYEFGTTEQNIIHAGLIGQLALDETPVDPDKLLPRYLRRTQAEVDWHKKTGKPFGLDSDYVEEV